MLASRRLGLVRRIYVQHNCDLRLNLDYEVLLTQLQFNLPSKMLLLVEVKQEAHVSRLDRTPLLHHHHHYTDKAKCSSSPPLSRHRDVRRDGGIPKKRPDRFQ